MEKTVSTVQTSLRTTRNLVQLALLAAIIVVLANTPLGMIQLPIVKATTIHIPVILGAVLLGPLAGGILGGVFGICSVISNTTVPTLLSFAFSPFLSTTGVPGIFKALWVSVGCRILIGVVAGWLWRACRKVNLPEIVALSLVGFLGSMTNTVLVMGSIYVLYAEQYAKAMNEAMTAVFALVMATVTGSGVPEAIAAAILVGVIGKALLKALSHTAK